MSLLNQFRVAGCGRPGVSDNWWGQSRSDGQRELLDAESEVVPVFVEFEVAVPHLRPA